MRSLSASRASSFAICVGALYCSGTARAQTVVPAASDPEPVSPAVSEPPPPAPSPAPISTATTVSPAAAPARPKIDLSTPQEKPDCVDPDEPAEGAGVFFIGLGFFDFAALNRRLRANGYES